VSTRRLFLPTAAGTIPVWVYGGPSTALNPNGGFSDMIGLPDGSIFLRNRDASLGLYSIFSAFGKGGTGGVGYAVIDPNIMPAPVAATGGLWSVSYNAVTGANITAPATAATVQANLNAISTVAAVGGVTVSGATGGPYTVTFNNNGAQLPFVKAVNTINTTGSNISAVLIAIVSPGSPSTQCVQTITPATGEGQAIGLLIGSDGTVQQKTLGTMTRGGTTAALSDSAAAALVSSQPCLLFGARNSLDYYKGGVQNPITSFALVNAKSGALVPGFAGLAIVKNSAISVQPDFLVFGDGGSNFGFFSPHLMTNNSTPTSLLYFTSWPTVNPGSSAGSVTKQYFISASTGVLTGPALTYGATGVNAPFLIDATGALSSQFSSGRFSMAIPAPLGGGLFLQDSFNQRQPSDPVNIPSPKITANTFFTRSGLVLTITVQITVLTTSPNYQYDVWGGSAGGYATVPLTSDMTQIGTAIASLFPDCTMSQSPVLTGSANNWTITNTVTITMPTGATYFPYLSGRMVYDGAGLAGTYTPLNEIDATFVTLCDSAGGHVTNIPAPTNVTSSLGVTAVTVPDSSGLAVNAGVICHAFAYKDPASSNYNWIVTIPGVIRLNIALSRANTLTNQGQNLYRGLYTQCQVAVVPFKNGFAIALPYLPRYVSTLGAPLNYAINAGKSGASTIITKCPILVIDSSGNVDTAFDANLWTNFWSLARTDGMRFGPNALVVKSGHLYFGSHYCPTYLSLAGPSPSPTDLSGNVLNPPSFAPFQAGGPGYEVLCACDTSGNRVLPPTHT
jgi:hypothetical protein